MSNGRTLKLLSLMIALAFILEQSAFAAPGGVIANPPKAGDAAIAQRAGLGDVIRDPSRITMAFEHGSVRETHSGTNDKLVLLIEDAHANLSGQKSIASLLDHFMTIYPIGMVLSEGGDGDASLTSVRDSVSRKDLNIGAQRLLYEGLIAGHEYLNLTSDHAMRIIGVESMDLYRDNLNAYSEITKIRDTNLKYTRHIRNSLNRLKNARYPKSLLRYETLTEQVPLDDFNHLMELSGENDLSAFPEIAKLSALKYRERQINFDRVNTEQRLLLERLRDQKEIADDVKRGKTSSPVSQGLYLKDLIQRAESSGVDTAPFGELSHYGEYLSLFQEIDMNELHRELDVFEEALYQKHLNTDELLIIRIIDKYIGILRKSYGLRLSTHEYEFLKSTRPILGTGAFEAFLNQMLIENDDYENLIRYEEHIQDAAPKVDEFYDLVNQRDMAFIRNIDFQMKNETASFLIAGGYHTSHITELLKAKGYSYAVLTPRVDDETDHKKYEDLLLASPNEHSGHTISQPLSASRMAAPRFDGARLTGSAAAVARVITRLENERGDGPPISAARLSASEAEIAAGDGLAEVVNFISGLSPITVSLSLIAAVTAGYLVTIFLLKIFHANIALYYVERAMDILNDATLLLKPFDGVARGTRQTAMSDLAVIRAELGQLVTMDLVYKERLASIAARVKQLRKSYVDPDTLPANLTTEAIDNLKLGPFDHWRSFLRWIFSLPGLSKTSSQMMASYLIKLEKSIDALLGQTTHSAARMAAAPETEFASEQQKTFDILKSRLTEMAEFMGWDSKSIIAGILFGDESYTGGISGPDENELFTTHRSASASVDEEINLAGESPKFKVYLDPEMRDDNRSDNQVYKISRANSLNERERGPQGPLHTIDYVINEIMVLEYLSMLPFESISTPHINRILAVGVLSDGRIWMKLEAWEDAHDLSSKQGGGIWNSLNLKKKLMLVRELLTTLGMVQTGGGITAPTHLQWGILHNDIKPQNILIHLNGDRELHLMLVDWDLSVIRGKLPAYRQGIALGTKGYQPPEPDIQRDESSDIFSLGRTLEKLISKRDFENERQSHADNESYAEYWGEAENIYLKMVKRMTDATQSERPQDVPQLLSGFNTNEGFVPGWDALLHQIQLAEQALQAARTAEPVHQVSTDRLLEEMSVVFSGYELGNIYINMDGEGPDWIRPENMKDFERRIQEIAAKHGLAVNKFIDMNTPQYYGIKSMMEQNQVSLTLEMERIKSSDSALSRYHDLPVRKTSVELAEPPASVLAKRNWFMDNSGDAARMTEGPEALDSSSPEDRALEAIRSGASNVADYIDRIGATVVIVSRHTQYTQKAFDDAWNDRIRAGKAKHQKPIVLGFDVAENNLFYLTEDRFETVDERTAKIKDIFESRETELGVSGIFEDATIVFLEDAVLTGTKFMNMKRHFKKTAAASVRLAALKGTRFVAITALPDEENYHAQQVRENTDFIGTKFPESVDRIRELNYILPHDGSAGSRAAERVLPRLGPGSHPLSPHVRTALSEIINTRDYIGARLALADQGMYRIYSMGSDGARTGGQQVFRSSDNRASRTAMTRAEEIQRLIQELRPLFPDISDMAYYEHAVGGLTSTVEGDAKEVLTELFEGHVTLNRFISGPEFKSKDDPTRRTAIISKAAAARLSKADVEPWAETLMGLLIYDSEHLSLEEVVYLNVVAVILKKYKDKENALDALREARIGLDITRFALDRETAAALHTLPGGVIERLTAIRVIQTRFVIRRILGEIITRAARLARATQTAA